MTNQQVDPAICGDDGPITPEECALWLDAQYRRNGDLEDRAAAMWLRKLSAKPAPEPPASPPDLRLCMHDGYSGPTLRCPMCSPNRGETHG